MILTRHILVVRPSFGRTVCAQFRSWRYCVGSTPHLTRS